MNTTEQKPEPPGDIRPFRVWWRVIGTHSEGEEYDEQYRKWRRTGPLYEVYALGVAKVYARSAWDARTRGFAQVMRQVSFDVPVDTVHMQFNVTKALPI